MRLFSTILGLVTKLAKVLASVRMSREHRQDSCASFIIKTPRSLVGVLTPSLLLAACCTPLPAQLPDSFLGQDGILTKQEISDGWIALFDGETFFGWRPQKAANFRVEAGAIVVDQGEQALLCTTTQFSDYILKLQFRADKNTNSGVFLRTPPAPKNVTEESFELNIASPDNPFPTGSLVQRAKVEGVGSDLDWHDYEVTMDGGHVVIKLDGKQILDYTDDKAVGRGFIGLQHNSGRVEFKNVKLKPLGTEPVFNGKDLSGWKQYPEMASKFTVTPEGNLYVRNGKGQLETEGMYGDFVLQLECITHGVHLNSGIFFRCIPGEEMNGYECQIQHGYLEGDRTKPMDFGTGAIFRLKPARRVVANDFEWFATTLIAEGPHIAAWVNGYPVTDWVDRRKPDKNPRRGLRTEAGTIMIQGHDSTTELSFRKLRIGEMKPRR